VAEGLTVDPVRMRANIEATRGVIFAERAMMLMGEKLGRDVAHDLMEEATRQSIAEGRHLVDVLAGMPEVLQCLDPATLRSLEVPEKYLGAGEEFRAALLASTQERKLGRRETGRFRRNRQGTKRRVTSKKK